MGFAFLDKAPKGKRVEPTELGNRLRPVTRAKNGRRVQREGSPMTAYKWRSFTKLALSDLATRPLTPSLSVPELDELEGLKASRETIACWLYA